MASIWRDPPMHRVLRAVARGNRTCKRIAKRAKLSEDHTRTYLKRLRDAGWIERVPIKGAVRERGESAVEYHITTIDCLLVDIWR